MTRLLLSSYGCARLWDQPKDSFFTYKDGMVITLLLSPDGPHGIARRGYPGFSYDTSLQLTHYANCDELLQGLLEVLYGSIRALEKARADDTAGFVRFIAEIVKEFQMKYL